MSRRPKATLAIEWSPKGIVVYDSATRQTRAFGDLREATGFAGQAAVIGVSRRSLFLRSTRVPNTDAVTIRQVLTMRTGELFPVAPSEIAMDVIPLSDVDLEGRLALVVAIPSGDLRRIRQEAKEVGIRVERVVPLALGSAILARSTGRQSAAIVSREPAGIGIDIIHEGELRHSRVVPEGPSIGAEICRTFSVAGVPCGEILAVDGAAGTEANVELSHTPLDSLLSDWPAEWTLNLELPDEVIARRRTILRQRMRLSVLMLTGALGFLGLIYTEYSDQAERVRRAESKAEGEQRHMKSILSALETDANKQAKIETALKRAFEPAQRLSDVVALIGNRAPAGVWLTGVSVERGKVIVVRGTSTNRDAVPTFLQKLTAEDRLRDVRLIFANDALLNEKPVVQFSLEAFPVGNLPFVETDSARKKVTR